MKNVFCYIVFFLLTIFFLTAAATASNITINVSAQFGCNLLSKYMEKHGYSYINEIPFNNTKTNLFAANNAEIIIRNKNNTALGTGRTDKKGNFSISVAEDSIYRIIVRFHGREVEEIVDTSNTKNIIADLGYFDSRTVDNWIKIKPVSYCFSCNLRYHENKESF